VRALISIGTNSTRLLIVDGERPVLHEVRGTRIGEGLHEHGPIAPEAARRTLEAVKEFAGIARERDAGIAGIATSALRRAQDAERFQASFEEIAGTPLQIVSGDEEAGYSFIGAVRGLHLHGENGVLDVGGGSSEYAYGDEQGAQCALSCEIGAVRLTERVRELDGRHGAASRDAVARARAIAVEALEPLRAQPKPQTLVVVGGTVFAAAAIVARQADRDKLSGTTLSRDALEKLLEQLVLLDVAGRKKIPHMTEQRADILPGGIIVVLSAMEILARNEIVISSADLLYGYLISQDDGETQEPPPNIIL
jgi:exopolyphosphatase / guanosine-5'-triphosphate,3'-diphosphate pyrophosphatase